MKAIAILILSIGMAVAQTRTMPLRNTISQGLVGYWSLNESAAPSFDSVGKNTLTNLGSVAYIPGKWGNCANFSANSQTLAVSDNAALSLGVGGSCTLAGWFCRTNTNTDCPAVWKGTGYNSRNTWEYGIRYAGAWYGFLGSGSANIAVSVTRATTATNVWDFLCMTIDAANKRFSLQLNTNPPSVLPLTIATQDTNGKFHIGGGDASQSFIGFIDEVGFWKRVLTPEEVMVLYNYGAGTHYPRFDNQAITYASGGAGGLTVASLAYFNRMPGTFTASNFWVNIKDIGPANGWKLKRLRASGGTTTGNLASQEDSAAFTPDGTGWQLVTLATPFSITEGDTLGVFLSGDASHPASARLFSQYTVSSTRFPQVVSASGDVSGTNSFAGSLSNSVSNIPVVPVFSPSVIWMGDSLFAGENAGNVWRPFLDGSGVYGALSNSIPGYLNIWGSVTNQYVNCAVSGTTSSAFNGNQGVAAVKYSNSATTKWIVHMGLNDVLMSQTWTTVSNNFNTLNSLKPGGVTLYVTEILPCNTASDTQSGTIRTFNSNFAAWCTAHSATLVTCHDAMGQIRGSTGQLDDLLTAYNHDGTHLTPAGVAAFANLVKSGAFP